MNEPLILNIPIIVLFFSTLLLLGVCCFLIGYLYGKRSSDGVSNVVNIKPKSFFEKIDDVKNKKIVIDSTKYVGDIKTDSLEKKYDQLGEIKETKENISESINKLKNLKR